MRRGSRRPGERLREGVRPIWIAIGAFATVTSALAGVLLVKGFFDSPEPAAIRYLGPPTMAIEVKARQGSGGFSDGIRGDGSRVVEVMTTVTNTGGSATSDAVVRMIPSRYFDLLPGSCRLRSSSRLSSRACTDNLVNGGVAFPQFGPGAWIRVSAKVKFTAEAVGSVAIRSLVNTEQTPEQIDTATVHAPAGAFYPARRLIDPTTQAGRKQMLLGPVMNSTRTARSGDERSFLDARHQSATARGSYSDPLSDATSRDGGSSFASMFGTIPIPRQMTVGEALRAIRGYAWRCREPSGPAFALAATSRSRIQRLGGPGWSRTHWTSWTLVTFESGT